jgi:aryl-phospho-beta-D-glucosidase BglC (GH1 family)
MSVTSVFWAKCKHIDGSTDFCLPNPISAICLYFLEQNALKNQYLSHLELKNYEINSIKSDSLRAFDDTKNAPKFQYNFQFQFYLVFIEKNGSIINSFHTVNSNNLKQSQCTLLIKSFLNILRAWHETLWWFGRSQHDKTKQTTLLHR